MEKVSKRNFANITEIDYKGKISIKKFNDVLLQLLVWLIVFDSARNYTYLPDAFGYLKDVIMIWFIIWLLINRKLKFPKMGIAFYLLMFLVCFYSWIGIFNSNGISKLTIVIYIVKNIGFFIAIIVFWNLDKIIDYKYSKYINLYLTLSLVLVAVNIFGYFVPNPIVGRSIDIHIGNGYYQNRISVGQPSIAVFPMIISYFYTFLFVKEKKVLKMIIYILGIVIAISTTGILTIVVGQIIILFFSNNMSKDTIRKLYKFIITLLLVGFVLWLMIKDTEVYQNAYEMLYIKLSAFFTGNYTDLSMVTRNNKFEVARRTMKTLGEKVFGRGAYGYYTNNSQIGNIENTYRSVFLAYGYFGEFVFILFWIKNIGNNLYKFINGKNIVNLFIAILCIIYMLHAYTLDILYTSTILLSFGLFFAIDRFRTE